MQVIFFVIIFAPRNQGQHLYKVARQIIHLIIFREGVYSSNTIQQKHICS
nr:MAG TPA: hypothetical protein [Caudoviricetes sp.]